MKQFAILRNRDEDSGQFSGKGASGVIIWEDPGVRVMGKDEDWVRIWGDYFQAEIAWAELHSQSETPLQDVFKSDYGYMAIYEFTDANKPILEEAVKSAEGFSRYVQ